jgi:hypothetical protein
MALSFGELSLPASQGVIKKFVFYFFTNQPPTCYAIPSIITYC